MALPPLLLYRRFLKNALTGGIKKTAPGGGGKKRCQPSSFALIFFFITIMTMPMTAIIPSQTMVMVFIHFTSLRPGARLIRSAWRGKS
jgi:hypothetical protein